MTNPQRVYRAFDRTHLNRFEVKDADYKALARAKHEYIQIIKDNLAAAERELANHEVQDAGRTQLGYSRAVNAVASLKSDLDAAQRAAESIRARAMPWQSALRSVHQLIYDRKLHASNTATATYPDIEIDPAGIAGAVEDCRTRMAGLASSLAPLKKAHVSQEEAAARIEGALDALGRDALAGLVEAAIAGAPGTLFASPLSVSAPGGPPAQTFQSVLPAALIVDIIGRDFILNKILELLRVRYNDLGPGTSREEIAARTASIAAEQLELEIREESLIRKAEDAGMEIPRRVDARPEILLGPIFDESEILSPLPPSRRPVDRRMSAPAQRTSQNLSWRDEIY